MQRITTATKELRELVEALKGEYGMFRMENGIVCRYQGGIVHFEGYFDSGNEVVEIPKVPVRIPVVFVGDDFSCMSVAEADAGFVNVPEMARQKRFAVLATCLLNT